MLQPQGVLENAANVSCTLHLLFVWSYVWSIGANLDDSSRAKFSEWCRVRFAHFSLAQDDYFACYVEVSTSTFVSWDKLIQPFIYDPNTPYFNIMVPTTETTKYGFLIEKLMISGYNVLFMGETGVGKSSVIQSFLNAPATKQSFVNCTMCYSAQTKPRNLREVFEAKLEKQRKNLLAPPVGKRMLMFIDDLNIPALEVYGAQPPNELLRQVIDSGGLYDVQKCFFKHIQGVVFAAAYAPLGGRRNEVSPRLIRHFHMVWLTNLSQASMMHIFTSILSGFLSRIAPTLTQCTSSLVKASVNIYARVEKELLPTPSRSHYTFNLRDLSKVFQGMLMTKREIILDSSALFTLWCHEKNRVFRDRLINTHDRTWFNGVVLHELHETLHSPSMREEDFVDLIYGDFMTRTNKVYKCLESRAEITAKLMEYLEEHNLSFPKMDLVFFNDAVHHVARISRVLRQPRGNLLLVGVGGSGRQSLTRLASFIAEYKCRQIEIRRGYGINEWREDLKSIFFAAGAKNESTVFLFSDTQIVTEGFLEDISNVLNSGEVPSLYEAEDIEKIANLVQPLAKKAGKLETQESILQHYVQLLRENLHIVLCMSPIGTGFRTRCCAFPSLVNCCTIDWFNPWSEDALYSVARKFLLGQETLGISNYVDPLCHMAVSIHRSVEQETDRFYKELRRYNYTTPMSYLELMKLYLSILAKQRNKVSNDELRYRIGLERLAETERVVVKLKEQLTVLHPVLDKASKEAHELLVKVTADQAEADGKAGVVEEDMLEANKVAHSVQAIQNDCQADLDEAMPAYNAALRALDALDKKSIQDLKTFNNPPEMVSITMQAVCVLFGVKPKWEEAKKLLGQMNFMDKLKEFEKDNIPPKTIKALKKYLDDPRFVPEEVCFAYSRICKNIT
jgi:dynein heavy chain